jgi:hypothetical protein
MSDMRYIIVSILLIFSGFLILGLFGYEYQIASIEASEFSECYDYQDNKEPIKVRCSDKIFDQVLFFVGVIGLIGIGIISLIKGIKGKWDNEVKPEDMVGPGGDKKKQKKIRR